MKKILAVVTLLFLGCSAAWAAPLNQLATNRPVWRNAGYVAVGDANVIDSTGLIGDQQQYNHIDANFGSGAVTVSTSSIPRRVTIDQSENFAKIRFRGSVVTSAGVFEIWGITGVGGDAEFIADVNLTADANAAPATMGGYYLGSVTVSNNGSDYAKSTVGGIYTSNSGASRMVVLKFDAETFLYIVIVPKQIDAGVIYWDYCGY